MNKRVKALIELVKVHKKESIGVAVALGIVAMGVTGYALNTHFSKEEAKSLNNKALTEAKEDIKTDKEDEKKNKNDKEVDNKDDLIIEENEDGTLIVKDEKGNIIADSSKGDDIGKVVADKKESGSNVNIKNDGKLESVDKVEDGSITITGGGTVNLTKPTKPNSNKPTKENKPVVKPDTGNDNTNKPTPPTNPKPEIEKPTPTPPPVTNPEKPQPPKPDIENNNTNNQTNPKPEEEKPKPTPPPVVTPPVEEEKPEPPVKPEPPKRTWEYQSSMSSELWSLFNQYRQENGLNALNWSDKYAGWVKQHTEEMAQKEDAFHKLYPEGGQVTGFDGSANMTASKILQGFKNSPQHNKNLLDDELTEGACAVYKDSNGVYYFVIGFDY